MTRRRLLKVAAIVLGIVVGYPLLLGQTKWFAEAAIEDCRLKVGVPAFSTEPRNWEATAIWPGGHELLSRHQRT